MRPTVRILGTHGVPAAYGGFETAAANVALYLERQGWRVIVYCQVAGTGPIHEDLWNGVERVLIPVQATGWLGTSRFDLLSIRHAARFDDVCLTFGYNTALFNLIQKAKRIPLVINMDGMEWSRARWGRTRQAILFANERIACRIGDHLIADHPLIHTYLAGKAPSKKISMITYGADSIDSPPDSAVRDLGLVPGEYATLICRPIPENSILELVSGYSARRRDRQLVVLGDYLADDEYHRAVRAAASDEVVFPGAIYDAATVQALRFHSFAYLHGHTVGGTNPSLVEAMAAGNPVIAHDNDYNRWTAGDAAVYFTTADDVDRLVGELLADPAAPTRMRAAALRRHAEEFTWEHVAGQYEAVLRDYVDHPSRTAGAR